ncbi:FMN-dependent NADH-azoreductase [Endozoicomonas sp. 8E]|uniref:FMN-dependent NADH-azoreductase n=1 Tax=Endozoicomonas sp. 8E TaxID=3035692 RepID=UPI002939172C|nr:NAD(P)H-dependent oxidoreductase [Endozoicomonas sp. 8E]WOG27170.1 NAD(P)H-dependent oxidoreductase [Endozoicomonas sp. 8E]
MSTILQIDSSLFGSQGQSGQLARQFVEKYTQTRTVDKVIYRDLGSEPIPHLTAESFQGFSLPEEERNEHQKSIASLSDRLISELNEADVLVMGLPLYNFTMPSTLKTYFDHIARAGITFRYTEQGPQGLLKGKKAYILAARGGEYQGTPMDTQTALIKHFLGFIGITDVEFIYAEGLAKGGDAREVALGKAAERIDQLVA